MKGALHYAMYCTSHSTLSRPQKHRMQTELVIFLLQGMDLIPLNDNLSGGGLVCIRNPTFDNPITKIPVPR